MNNMVTTTMSPRAIASRHRSSAPVSLPHSSAAWISSDAPGVSRRNRSAARWVALDRWLSIVTRTIRTALRSAAEMRFGIVECLHRDHRDRALPGEAFGVAARLAAHEKRDLREFLLGVGMPAKGVRRGRRV